MKIITRLLISIIVTRIIRNIIEVKSARMKKKVSLARAQFGLRKSTVDSIFSRCVSWLKIIDIDNLYEDYWREKERKKDRKKEEESYPHVSPPEEDLLDQLSFRWIILVKIIKGYSRIIETDIRIYVMVRG